MMKIAKRGLWVGVLGLGLMPVMLRAQTDPSSNPGSNPASNPASGPGTSGGQTTPGVRRGTASGDPDVNQGGDGTDSAAMKDKIFLRKAAQGGLAEVKLGELASEKAGSDDVKQFGKRMVTDHTRLNEMMKPIADEMGVMVPTKLNKMDQAEYDKLSGMSGDAFDKEYLAYMTRDHHQDIKEFEAESEHGGDPTLKETAATGLRVIARHARMVEKLDAAHGVKVGGS